MQGDEKIYLKTSRYLSREEFDEYLSLMRKIALWIPQKRAWEVDPYKFSALTREEAECLISRLRELGVEGADKLFSLLPKAEGRRVRIEFDGNFVVVKFLHPGVYEELTYSETPEGTTILDMLLSYKVKKFDRYTRQFYWQTIKRYWLYFDRLVTFRGLLPRLAQLFDISNTKWTNLSWREPERVSLRDYQREAVVEAFNQLELCGAATIQAATGSGKTEMAIALWEALGRPKTYFLSLNTDLLIQAKQRWEKYGFTDTGLVNKDNFEIGRNVVFCTVQTLYRAVERIREDIKYEGNGNGVTDEILLEERDLKGQEAAQLAADYNRAELVIFDECQHIPARTVWTVLIFHPNSMRLALSATPWRDDGRDLDIYAVAGEPVKRKITSSELCDRGFLVPAEINFVIYRPAWAENFRKRKNVWQLIKKLIFEDEERNRLIAQLTAKSPKPVLVLVKEIKHGRLITQECKKAGLKTKFIYGELNPRKRAQLLEAGRKGLLDVIVATTLADEGLDWPSLRTLILAGGGKSSTRALQRVGRIVRPFGGKEVGLVWDLWDEVRYFQEHAEARKKIYETEPRWRIRFLTIEEALEGGRG